MIKLVLLFKKREDLTTEAFIRYWRDVHVPLVLRVPDIKRYVVSSVIGAPLEMRTTTAWPSSGSNRRKSRGARWPAPKRAPQRRTRTTS